MTIWSECNADEESGIIAVQKVATTPRITTSRIVGGGVMGELIRTYDWENSLGPIEDWSFSLVAATNIILQSTVPIVMLWGDKGYMLYNDAYSIFASKRHPSLLGSEVLKGWPEVADFNQHVLDEVLIKGKTLTYKDQELTLYRKNQAEEVWMDLYYSPIIDDDGKTGGVMAIVVETTEIIEAEELKATAEKNLLKEKKTLEESEVRFRTLIEKSMDAVQLVSPEGKVLYSTDSVERVLGYKAKEIQGVIVTPYLHPDDVKPFTARWLKLLEKPGAVDTLRYRVKHKDGKYVLLETTLTNHLGTPGIEAILGNFRDVTEEAKAEIEHERVVALENQKKDLLRVNKAKDEFISLASHQLRTPATAVKQYLGIVLNEYVGPISADQTQYLQTAYNSNERQLRIIDDLLKTAQLDAAGYALQKSQIVWKQLIDEIIEEFESTLELKRQTISFSTNDPQLATTVDGGEMKLVLVNLIENASKYSHHGKAIAVKVTKLKSKIAISVTDNGVGIAQGNQKKIFDKFTRIDNDLSDTVTGSGLGLYWVKKIIKLHGGSIEVKSKVGIGTTITIRLPL